MIQKFLVLGAALVFAATPVLADSITKTGTGGTVDGSFMTKTVGVAAGDFTGSGTILDVNITVDFTKIDTSTPGSSFASEIIFRLTSPGGTTVNLIDAFTYNTTQGTVSATITFDDAGGALGATVASGTFAPTGTLADFNGENALGTWSFYFEDTVGADPLTVRSWELNITTADDQNDGPAPTPEPGTLALVAGAMAAVVVRRRRRKQQG